MAQAYKTETGSGGAEPERPEPRLRSLLDRARHDRGIWRRGIVLAVFAVLLALILGAHSKIPNTFGNLGSLVETFLPWFGLGIPLLLLLALVRKSATALIAVLLPAVVWTSLFGGLIFDKSGTGGDLTVATHNVDADNPDPVGTARSVVDSGADVVALEELTQDDLPVYREELAGAYKYHAVEGTVGLWSKYPLTETRPVDLELGWSRALRSTVQTPKGQVAVYVAHLPSVRVKASAGFTAGKRDTSAEALGTALRDEKLDKVVLLGDLNGTMNDRALSPVTAQMRSTQGAAGDGFGFSWPARFPMARIDQILVRGVEPESSWTLPRTTSDHLPLAARVQL